VPVVHGSSNGGDEMRNQRFETYTTEHRRTIDTYSCNNCGVTVDGEGVGSMPTGWHSLSFRDGDKYRSFHFDEYECLYGFVMAHEDALPSKLQEDLENSIAILTAEKELAR
jgi:hypothetical protein